MLHFEVARWFELS